MLKKYTHLRIVAKWNTRWLILNFGNSQALILWPSYAKSWLTGKDPDAGKDGVQEEKRVTEVEMVGWHHWFNGHEFKQTLGDNGGQGSQGCCSS